MTTRIEIIADIHMRGTKPHTLRAVLFLSKKGVRLAHASFPQHCGVTRSSLHVIWWHGAFDSMCACGRVADDIAIADATSVQFTPYSNARLLRAWLLQSHDVKVRRGLDEDELALRRVRRSPLAQECRAKRNGAHGVQVAQGSYAASAPVHAALQ